MAGNHLHFPDRRACGERLPSAGAAPIVLEPRRLARPPGRARGARRRLDDAAPGRRQRPAEAPGRGLPLHLLLLPAGPAAPLASRRRRRARRRGPGRVRAATTCRRPRRAPWTRPRTGPPAAIAVDPRAARAHRRAGGRTSAASACTSGRWSTARPRTRSGTTPGRCASRPAGTAEVVEDNRVRCSHFDAFRFFTAPARPLNLLAPTRETQHELEQPGCLHANMDLYKWAYKLSPAGAAASWSPTASRWPARSARWTCGPAPTTCGAGLSADADRDARRAAPSTPPPSATSPTAPTVAPPDDRCPGRAHASVLTARATTSATSTSEMPDWTNMASFAQRDSGIVSVGLNAVVLVKER